MCCDTFSRTGNVISKDLYLRIIVRKINPINSRIFHSLHLILPTRALSFNINIYIITAPTCFDAFASSSGGYLSICNCKLGVAVAQLVEAVHYKLEGCGFDSGCGHWNFSVTMALG